MNDLERAIASTDLSHLFDACDNTGRWGPDDERGTLNLMDSDTILAASRLVRTGVVIPIGRLLRPGPTPVAKAPFVHSMLLQHNPPTASIDRISLACHDPVITHLDAVCHAFWNGRAYNGRTAAVVTPEGLTFGSIGAQRTGILTRGVLLDIPGARGVEYLAEDDFVRVSDLERAEDRQGVRVARGDAVVVHVGRERRVALEHPEGETLPRAGLHHEVLPWLHERQVAVYTGDCTERLPYPNETVPMPLHQVGLVAMGLCMLDSPTLTELVAHCRRTGVWEFLLTCAAVDAPGATGWAVNPLCVF
jgi:hypothetical protein